MRGAYGECRAAVTCTGSAIRANAVSTAGLNRSTNPHMIGTPRRCAAPMTSSVPGRSAHTGFSTSSGSPALMISRASA
jgi:hypothetical protein